VIWLGVDVGLAVVGLLVLALLTLRLWRQVRGFARDVGNAGERLAAATEELSRLSPPRR
jgi:hypothetical protein